MIVCITMHFFSPVWWIDIRYFDHIHDRVISVYMMMFLHVWKKVSKRRGEMAKIGKVFMIFCRKADPQRQLHLFPRNYKFVRYITPPTNHTKNCLSKLLSKLFYNLTLKLSTNFTQNFLQDFSIFLLKRIDGQFDENLDQFLINMTFREHFWVNSRGHFKWLFMDLWY